MHEMHDGWPHDSEVTQRERLPRVLAFGLSAQGIAGRSANFWFERGHNLEVRNRRSEAAEAYRMALRILPEFAEARFNLARCYEQLSRMTAAARQWSIYLNLDPDGEWADVARQSLRQCGCARRADLVLRRD